MLCVVTHKHKADDTPVEEFSEQIQKELLIQSFFQVSSLIKLHNIYSDLFLNASDDRQKDNGHAMNTRQTSAHTSGILIIFILFIIIILVEYRPV